MQDILNIYITLQFQKKFIFKILLINPEFKYMYAHRKYNYYKKI